MKKYYKAALASAVLGCLANVPSAAAEFPAFHGSYLCDDSSSLKANIDGFNGSHIFSTDLNMGYLPQVFTLNIGKEAFASKPHYCDVRGVDHCRNQTYSAISRIDRVHIHYSLEFLNWSRRWVQSYISGTFDFIISPSDALLVSYKTTWEPGEGDPNGATRTRNGSVVCRPSLSVK